ncbi:hypothetical protein GGP41_007827 [Bipolaris sorokiniana]|uniref:Uncharacterized protein n=1 Tax=Cochliobolus sativus TaxID=45130 RepID=A0A8H5ZLD2_COCSA|nr:hypothetical protein GGP41_007827 [Bipolaris sorokiniana]
MFLLRGGWLTCITGKGDSLVDSGKKPGWVWIADLSGITQDGRRLFNRYLDIFATQIYFTIVGFSYNLNSLLRRLGD